MKKFNKESGQALVFVAVSGMILLGFAALATDAGVLLHSRKQMQSAADSAAIAGAYELTLTGKYSSAQTAGMTDAANNGFSGGTNCPATPNTSGPTVCIKEPTNDSNTAFNSYGYVEADISAPMPTPFIRTFLAWFNPGQPPLTVAARAVAVSEGGAGAPNGCISVLSSNAADAMDLQGHFNVDAPHCAVNINSSNLDALQFTGASGTLTAGSISVAGGDGGHPSDANPTPTIKAPQFSDPLQFRDLSAEMAHLTDGTLSCSAYTGAAPVWTTLTPEATQTDTVTGNNFGTYQAVCYSGSVSLTNLNPMPVPASGNGVYFFTGNVTISGDINTATTGVTLVIANGSLVVSPGAQENVTLYAPPLDTKASPDPTLWNGMLIYMPASNACAIAGVSSGATCIQLQQGSSNMSLTGIIYAPTANLALQDGGGNHNGGVSLTTALVVGTLSDTAADLSMFSYLGSQGGTGAGTFPKVTLVE